MVVGHDSPNVLRLPIRSGVLYDVIWLDHPDHPDEIDGSNLKMVTEATYQIELIERELDR
jgi:hypothetical protein|tara:strand:+ start:145 stop:324 length:180 start_codon:yes stop_codon:yes gene_type:complete